MILDLFRVLLYDYDVRKASDFEEMKDARLSEAHFQGIRKRLFPHLAEGELDSKEPNQHLLLRMDQICGDMSVIEAMRDQGLPAPRLGLRDVGRRTDGADSLAPLASSDDIEFFKGGSAAEMEPKSGEEASAAKDGRERTTFPHDLRLISTLLSSLPHPIPLPPQAGPQEHDIQRDLPDMLSRMFHIILDDYDYHNPIDFEEAKDTAGLSEEHFLGIWKRLYPNSNPNVECDDDDLQCMLQELCGRVNAIEMTRDEGLPPPGQPDSDDLEFFTGGSAAALEPKSDEQASAGKAEA